MKKIISILGLLLLLLTVISTDAQNNNWDSSFRPNNWAIKWGEFKSYPNAADDIIFLGNSIMAGIEWNELLGLKNAKNRGISGDISFGILERLEEVVEGKPAKIFVLIGINDISRNIPDSIILHNYARIIDYVQFQSPKTKLIFHTLMPVNNEFTQFKNHYNKDQHIAVINAGLKALATEKKIGLIDLHPIFQDANGKLDKKYTIDGLHINADGYKVWANLLFKSGYLK